MMNKTYSKLMSFSTFKERFDYLKIPGKIGEETFGYDRYLNQVFYKSKKWLKTRNEIIVRDNGCDLGIKDREIIGEPIIVHHINPITIEDIENDDPILYDPENLISSRDKTHKGIHFGDLKDFSDPFLLEERKPGDTCLWERRTK